MNIYGCSQPWFEMQIKHDCSIGFCCYYKDKVDEYDPDEKIDIDKYWNSDNIKKARNIILNNRPYGTGCDGCQYAELNLVSNTGCFHSMPEYVKGEQRDNFQKAINNYESKKVEVDSYPVKYYLSFGLTCNIKCIMCSQKNLRIKDHRRLKVERLLEIREYLSKANEIAIIGGEPLCMPECRKFLEVISKDPKFKDVKISLYTNGLLLDEYFEILKSFRRVSIAVSLDSIGERYEYIRRGASWRKVEKNIIDFQNIGKENGLDWSVGIACVVMKSSISTLVDLIEWCNKYNLNIGFVPIFNEKDDDEEDIFKNPLLLDDIPDWKDIFEEAIEKLKINKKDYKPLEIMKNKIYRWYRVLVENKKLINEVSLNDDIVKFLDDKNKKRVILFGASIAGKKIHNLIRNMNEKSNVNIKVVAFCDNDKNKWGNFIEGVQILEPNDSLLRKSDYIIISSMYVSEIKKQLVDMGMENERIIAL